STPIGTQYALNTQRFLARARYESNTLWTPTENRGVVVDPPAGSGPTLVSVTSATFVQQGSTVQLTANGASASCDRVNFYYDSNGNGTLDYYGPGADEFLFFRTLAQGFQGSWPTSSL